MCHACRGLVAFQVMNFSRSKKKMNISTKIRKDFVYTVVSAGVFCRTQKAKCTVFLRLVSLVFGCGYLLDRIPQ